MQKPEEHPISQITFVGEQDGKPERELKQELVKFFSSRLDIESAYLARVHYDKPEDWHVALCLVGEPNEEVLGEVGNIFYTMFGQDSHMDVILLNDTQKLEIQRTVKSFFQIAHS
jgi:hypothetical protein